MARGSAGTTAHCTEASGRTERLLTAYQHIQHHQSYIRVKSLSFATLRAV